MFNSDHLWERVQDAYFNIPAANALVQALANGLERDEKIGRRFLMDVLGHEPLLNLFETAHKLQALKIKNAMLEPGATVMVRPQGNPDCNDGGWQ